MSGSRIAAAMIIAPVMSIGVLSVADALLPSVRKSTVMTSTMTVTQPDQTLRRWAERTVQYVPAQGCRVSSVRLSGRFSANIDEDPVAAAVRSGPGLGYPSIDTVRDGEIVLVCQERASDEAEGREWAGIVYGRLPERCNVSGSSNGQRVYSGPCRNGWIEHRDLDQGQQIASDSE